MKKTTFFFKAAGVAVLFCLAAVAYTGYQTNQVNAAKERCEAESAALQKGAVSKEAGQWKVSLLCDPAELYKNSWEPNFVRPPGAQGELLTAYQRQRSSDLPTILYILAFLVAVVGVIPAVWYFLLARLSEVAAAVRRR